MSIHYPQRTITDTPNNYNTDTHSNFDYAKCTAALESGTEQTAVILIYLLSGNTVTITSEDIWQNGLTVDKNFSSNNSEFPIGSCASSKVSIDIVNKTYIDNQNNEVSPYDFKNCRARVTVYVRCKDENDQDEAFDRDIYQGYFVLQEIDYTQSHFSVTGNDYMVYLGYSYEDLMAKGVVDQSDNNKNINQIAWTSTTNPDSSTAFSPVAFFQELARRNALYYKGIHTWGTGGTIYATYPLIHEFLSAYAPTFPAQGLSTSETYFPVFASSYNSTMTIAEMIGEYLGLMGCNLYADDAGRLNYSPLHQGGVNDIFELTPANAFSHKFYSNVEKEFYFQASVFLKSQDFKKYQYIYLDKNKFLMSRAREGVGWLRQPQTGMTNEPTIYNLRFYKESYIDGSLRKWRIKSQKLFAFEADILPAPYLSPDDYIKILRFNELEYSVYTYLTEVSYTLNGRTRIACDVRYEDNKYLYQ